MPIVHAVFGDVDVPQKLYDKIANRIPKITCKYCGVQMRYSTKQCGHNDFFDVATCPRCSRSYSGYGVDELKRNINSS